MTLQPFYLVILVKIVCLFHLLTYLQKLFGIHEPTALPTPQESLR